MDMADQTEKITVNIEVTPGNTEEAAPGVKGEEPGIPCLVT